MKTVFQFLAKTKNVSRILVALWVFFCSFGIGSDNFILGCSIGSIIFILPVIIIEIKTNPVLRNNTQDVHKQRKNVTQRRKVSIILCRIFGAALTFLGGLFAFMFCIMFIVSLIPSSGANANDFTVPSICVALSGTLLCFTGRSIFKGTYEPENTIKKQNSQANNVIPEYTDNAHSYIDTNDIIENDEVSFEDFVDDDLDEYDTANIVSEELEEEEFEEIDPTDVSYVDGMDGHEFEYFCAELLRKNDFYDVSVTRGSGDQGVDILATKGGVKYAVQCKNYASPLSNTPVQEVAAGKLFYNCHVGVVLTNSTFTPGAVSLANAAGILLWDRSVLSELMKKGQTAPNNFVEANSKGFSSHQLKTPTPPPASVHPQFVGIESNTHNDTCRNVQRIINTREYNPIDSIDVEIDGDSVKRLGIVIDNFGAKIDEDDDNQIELLFDVRSRFGRFIPCDIEIVLNLYSGNRKLLTEKERIYRDSFSGRDSLCVYFEMKNLCKLATKIEMFCQKW